MATDAPEKFTALEHDDVVVLPGIGWEGFEAVARLKGDRRRPRLLYSEGSLTLMSPGQAHEFGGKLLDRIIMAICAELDVGCTSFGATLFRRRDQDKGIEGDEVYYITREPEIRGKEVDLDAGDPPPDLAVEVENTHPAREAVEIWRRLGVPEVWVDKARASRLAILHLDADGRYAEAPASRALPFLAAGDVLGWVLQKEDEPESRWERRLRAWVRDELARRLEAGGDPE